MRKTITLLTLFIMAFSLIYAIEDPVNVNTPGALTGRVVDESGYVLPGATITVEGTNIGSVSDVNGFFRLNGLEDGNYKVKISYIGFNPEEKDIVISNNRTSSLDNIVLREGILMKEIVVTGLNSQHKAMSQQKNNINISNVISADQVSRFPDSNIGDALKRIPGINVQYDQGEARFGHIRGTNPNLNSVQIDGTRIPSAESGERSVQLDLIPSDMVQTIEVNKVITPDMDADAIGGSVNLITKSQPVGRRITALAGSGYNLISERPTLNLGFSYGDRYFNDNLGMVFALSYQNNPAGSDNVEFEWEKDDNGKMYTADYQVRQYYVQRERQSYSLAFDYVFNPDHKIYWSGLYNKRRDWETRYRMSIESEPDGDGGYISEVVRDLKFGSSDTKNARLEDQQVQSFSLGGEHFFGNLGMTWGGNYSKASQERPHERAMGVIVEDVETQFDFSDTRKPYFRSSPVDINNISSFEFDELEESYGYTDDRDITAKVDFTLPFNTSGSWMNSLKFGGSIKDKSKSNHSELISYEPINEDGFNDLIHRTATDETRDNFLAGDYKAGQFPNTKEIGAISLAENSDFEYEEDIEEGLANFDADETVTAGYIRYDQRLYDKVDLLLGLRVENTRSKYNAFQFDEEEEILTPVSSEDDSYTNFLPAVIAKWDVNNDFKVKAAWTNTLARPNYDFLAPTKSFSNIENYITVGNPELLPTKSMNFDLMAEYYVNGGLFSAGVFYKDIIDFIVEERLSNHTFDNHTWDRFTRPINAGDANLFGFEASIQQNLNFLPGFLKHFNVYTNYTYNHSSVKNFNYEGRENEELSMPGTPSHTFNAALGYDTRKFSARLSYNFASDFIDELGEEAFYDRYYDKVNYLDFNMNVRVGDYVNIYANVNNLLNQPLRYYQGSKEYTMQTEYYNVRFDAGVKVTF